MFYVFLVLDVVVPPVVAIKGVHWAKDGAINFLIVLMGVMHPIWPSKI
jgi:uncharacterized membrane protein YqaE (UPF0057 family)